jgi:hypothetical protein
MTNGPEDSENSSADILPFQRRDGKRPTVRFVETPDSDDPEIDQADLKSEESWRALLAYNGITDPKEQDERITILRKTAGAEAGKATIQNVAPIDSAWSRRPKKDLSDVPEF